MSHFIFRFASASWLLLMLTGTGIWASPPRLDSAKVHSLYLDGEFEAAIAILEANLKDTRPYRREDSVFIFKHLGVMYAAQFDTREKGKYFMHKLLAVEPTAKILDMYASDMIYMIFRNIQEEYEQTRLFMGMQRHGRSRTDTLSGTIESKATQGTSKEKPQDTVSRASNGKKWMWGGAAVAGLGVGVGAYFLMNDRQTKVDSRDFEF